MPWTFGHMTSIVRPTLKIVAYLDKKFHHLILPKLETLHPYATVLDAGTAVDEYTEESLNDANVLLLHGHASHAFEKLYPKMPKLEWVHSCSAGVDWLLNSSCGEALRKHPTQVLTNAKGCYSLSLAEYTIGAILYFEKQMPRLQQQRKERSWNRFMMDQLPGKTLGIIGYGDIGQKCAQLAKPFGLNVIGLRKSPEKSKNDLYITKCLPASEINALVSECDFVVLSCALTKDTVGLIGQEQLALMKPSCVIINISRGACVNEDALIHSLVEGKIKGAALDVTSTEPLPKSSRLWEIPDEKLLLSPHNADFTPNMVEDALDMFLGKLAYYHKHAVHKDVVNKMSGY